MKLPMRQRDIELVDLDAVLEGLHLEVARFQPPERSEPSVASMTIIGDFVHRRDQREAGALYLIVAKLARQRTSTTSGSRPRRPKRL
jgi:hypothetical protein